MSTNGKKLSRGRLTEKDSWFFEQPADVLAPQLLGKIICREFIEDEIEFSIRGRITETEAYCRKEIDSACHDDEMQYKKGGTIYFHKIRGNGSFDIVANKEGVGEGVLIRHIDSYEDAMYKSTDAFYIDELGGEYLLDSNSKIYLEYDGVEIEQNEPRKRKNLGVNIDEETKARLWNFSVAKITYAR